MPKNTSLLDLANRVERQGRSLAIPRSGVIGVMIVRLRNVWSVALFLIALAWLSMEMGWSDPIEAFQKAALVTGFALATTALARRE